MKVAPLLALVALLAAACGASTQQAAPRAQILKLGGDWARAGYTASRRDSGPSRTGITAANVTALRRRQITARRHRRLLADLPPRRAHRGRARTTSSSSRRRTARRSRSTPTSGRRLWEFTPSSYSRLAQSPQITNAAPARRPPRRRRLRRVAGRPHPPARARDGEAGLVGRDHAGREAREDRLAAQPRGGPPDRRDRRLHRRRAALPGPRRHDRAEDRPDPARLELALLQPARADRSARPAARATRRSGAGTPPSSSRAPAACSSRPATRLERPHELGRQRARALGRRLAAAPELDAVEPGGARAHRRRSRLHRRRRSCRGGSRSRAARTRACTCSTCEAERDGPRRRRAPGASSRTCRRRAAPPSSPRPPSGRAAAAPGCSSPPATAPAPSRSPARRLHPAWRSSRPGRARSSPAACSTSTTRRGRLNVLRPTTGALVASLPAGAGHWQAPIVTDGRIALPEGDANDHRDSGILDVYRAS